MDKKEELLFKLKNYYIRHGNDEKFQGYVKRLMEEKGNVGLEIVRSLSGIKNFEIELPLEYLDRIYTPAEMVEYTNKQVMLHHTLPDGTLTEEGNALVNFVEDKIIDKSNDLYGGELETIGRPSKVLPYLAKNLNKRHVDKLIDIFLASYLTSFNTYMEFSKAIGYEYIDRTIDKLIDLLSYPIGNILDTVSPNDIYNLADTYIKYSASENKDEVIDKITDIFVKVVSTSQYSAYHHSIVIKYANNIPYCDLNKIKELFLSLPLNLDKTIEFFKSLHLKIDESALKTISVKFMHQKPDADEIENFLVAFPKADLGYITYMFTNYNSPQCDELVYFAKKFESRLSKENLVEIKNAVSSYGNDQIFRFYQLFPQTFTSIEEDIDALVDGDGTVDTNKVD